MAANTDTVQSGLHTKVNERPVSRPVDLKTEMEAVLAKEPSLYQLAFRGDLPQLKVSLTLSNRNQASEFLGRTPLVFAVFGEQLKVAEYLLNMGADINAVDKYGETLLMLLASDPKYQKWLEWAIKNKAKVDKRNEMGFPALLYALNVRYLPSITYLMNNGASIDMQDNMGRTIPHIALYHANLPVLKFAVKMKAKINTIDNKKLTPLMIAIIQGVPFVECLVGGGIDLYQCDDEGNTPLLRAVHFNKVDVIEYLFKIGIRLDDANKVGLTPEKHAINKNYKHITSLFRQERRFRKLLDLIANNQYPSSVLDLKFIKIDAFRMQKLCDALSVNTSISILKFAGNWVDDNSLKILAAFISKNKILQAVDLSNTQITTEGVKFLAMAIASQTPKTMVALKLGGNNIDRKLKKEIDTALENNRKARLLAEKTRSDQNKVNQPDSVFESQEIFTAKILDRPYEELGKSEAELVSPELDRILQMIDKVTNSTVILSFKEINNQYLRKIMMALVKNKNITTLHMNNNWIDDIGAMYIAEILTGAECEFSCIDLSHNCIGDFGAVLLAKALQINQKIREIDLGHNRINDWGVWNLASSFEVVKSLNIKLAQPRVTVMQTHYWQVAIHYKNKEKSSNVHEESELYGAAYHGNIAVLEKGVKPENINKLSDVYGLSLLAFAISGNQVRTAFWLIKRGADINLSAKNGTTPLMFAARCASMFMIIELIGLKARLDLKDHKGRTALHNAVVMDRYLNAKLLITEYKMNVNEVNLAGESILLTAVKANNVFMATLLLENGADVHYVDREGYNVLMWAKTQSTEMVKLVTERGAKLEHPQKRILDPSVGPMEVGENVKEPGEKKLKTSGH